MTVTDKIQTMLEAVSSVLGILKDELQSLSPEAKVCMRVLYLLKSIELYQITDDEFFTLSGISFLMVPKTYTSAMESILIDLVHAKYRQLCSDWKYGDDEIINDHTKKL